MDSTTTVKESYVCPSSLATDVRIVGKKQELLTKQLYNIVSSEVEEEFYPPPSPPEYTSTTKKDFDKDFTPTAPPPKQTHNVYTESPATYWAENSHSVTGVTQVQKTLSPFHKNSAFSTPIEEYLDQPKPHDIN